YHPRQHPGTSAVVMGRSCRSAVPSQRSLFLPGREGGGHPAHLPTPARPRDSCLLACATTSSSLTGTPPRRLLSSAASMKATISSASAQLTGGRPVRKNLPTSISKGSYPPAPWP